MNLTSPIGTIPKPYQPGKFCTIVDLSAPQGDSINDGIDAMVCSLGFTSVEQAVKLVKYMYLGRGALLGKLELSSAYRRVPVHPDDQHPLGLEWQGVIHNVYNDTALPFELCSAPKIFTAIVDTLTCAMFTRGIGNFLHYLDDFLYCTPQSPPVCAMAMEQSHYALKGASQYM